MAAAVLAAASGCQHNGGQVGQEAKAAQPEFTGLDAHLQYSNRWIENSKVDLMAPEGTFLRAAVESMDRALFASGEGMTAIEAGGYPGIVHAFNKSANPTVVAGVGNKDSVFVGTDYWEVVDFRRSGDQFFASVCGYESMTAVKRSGDFEHPGRIPPNGHAVTVAFGPDANLRPDAQRAPKANQRGGGRAPIDNVFGTWVMTQYRNYNLDVEYPQCRTTLAPGTPADAPDHRYYDETPPPTLPPSPGWPSG
ncbi:hypothetical protein [Mycolicibacterium sp. CBMA 234]|uniref:hypothetical protein n=1 Tax=Mycolicibacterium sp. CBMA 234 TaxID=1918495 RepID=UPI0012DCC257|nr:hypothetical protein [Mycolicibacterium sp. CBMA 234]